ncbi:hypothetical protein HY29_05555 [Hyphomonas beringensis]|uniref:TrkH family potassium uptake protein n=1 Tax=Hyphomonas beringensis TaxID=1280946 RepID=A0A062U5U0_9PROT|nr:potassium transporter TrkG [Hyphomonas beringensis]KCZ52004.1 hypothetical protein HY29_05555 [Hyphomonas beringensis]
MLIVAAAAVPSVVISFFAGEDSQTFAFIAMILTIIVVASSVLLLTPKPSRKAMPSDALGTVILWWFITPVVTALPFILGVDNDSIVRGLHEATSCLTTTGQSVIDVENDVWPISLVVWRGMLHLLGGLATIVTAASVLAALNIGGPGIHRTVLFTVPETSFFDAVPRVARVVCAMMAISILALFAALVLLGVPAERALGDTVSVLTTGLVDPAGAGRQPLDTGPSIILGLGLIVGAMGLAIWLPLRDWKPLKAITDPELVLFIILIGVFVLAAVLSDLNVTEGLSWAISALSTSGLPLSDPNDYQRIPLTVLVLPALIGGSALSAAGGVKIARLIVLSRRAGQEFRQLGYRRSILGFQFRDRELDERSVIGVWVYLIAYIFAVFAVMIGYSFLGESFDPSIRLSIGSLTNSGAVVGDYASNLNPAADLLTIFAMILGRLEILALFPALSVSFWRG